MLTLACSSCEDTSHNEGPSQPDGFILINSMETLFLNKVHSETLPSQAVRE